MEQQQGATGPAYGIQPPPEAVAVWLSRARHERSLAVHRLDALERTAAGIRTAIRVWEDRIKLLETMAQPDIWTSEIEAKLNVPQPKDAQ